MKITLVLVTSLNGKLTKGEDPDIYNWTSPEDQAHFFSLIQKNSVMIMGRKTYEAAKNKMKLVPGKLRIVLTKEPQKYHTNTVPEQLEFTDETPKQLVQRLEASGQKKALLVGGSEVASLFFQQKLISTLQLTLEPKLFGEGQLFIGGQENEVELTLQSVRRLNKRGTLLLKYKVN